MRIKELVSVTDNRACNIYLKQRVFTYCYICQKRAGTYFAYCGPGLIYGQHGSKKLLSSRKYRSFKSWKHNRKTQWKGKI